MKTRPHEWNKDTLLVLFIVGASQTIFAAADEHWDGRVGYPGVTDAVGVVGVAEHQGDLYVFGSFHSVGGITATNIARWKGGDWSPLGEGVGSRTVSAAASDGRYLYAGGFFASAGGVTANNIARWDGTNWSSLGEGVNGSVRSIVASGSSVFAAGLFTNASGTTANNVAQWDGAKWLALGDGIAPIVQNSFYLGTVHSLAVDSTNLIVGGSFRRAGNVAAMNIARWNGSEWQALGGGLRVIDASNPLYPENGNVSALAVMNGFIYAGGDFRLAGDINATNIARWSGDTGWQPVGNGRNDPSISALVPNGNTLYAGGSFLMIGGVQVNRIALWDGNTWAPLGNGIQWGDGIKNLAVSGDRLFVGGHFWAAGGKPSTNVAIWNIPHALSIEHQRGQVRIRWPATGSNYVLEAKSAMHETNWSEVSGIGAVDRDQWVVHDLVENHNRFYRLRRE
ncbi:MAG: hypothetical protein KF833_02340 [Verrucomicrobiae bacterium]|nr:hypothetical protein [Verrucomicrobiae bacterium]